MLRPNGDRARAASLLLYIVLAFNVLAIGSGFMQYRLLGRMAEGETFPQELLERNDLREQVIGIAFVLVYVTCGVLFIRWFRRAYFNLHTLATGLRDSEGWAAGAWFVPIVNLYKPFQLMKDCSSGPRSFWIGAVRYTGRRTPACSTSGGPCGSPAASWAGSASAWP